MRDDISWEERAISVSGGCAKSTSSIQYLRECVIGQYSGERIRLREITDALEIGRNDSGIRSLSLNLTLPLIRQKKEGFVFPDRPPQCSAKVVLFQVRAPNIKVSLRIQTLLRKNSKRLPCQALVPDLVTTLITEPELRPYSASKVLVMTRNS